MDINIFIYLCIPNMVDVAQSVRASDCGSEGRRFEPALPPEKTGQKWLVFFL